MKTVSDILEEEINKVIIQMSSARYQKLVTHYESRLGALKDLEKILISENPYYAGGFA